jgi:hypothetical protein
MTSLAIHAALGLLTIGVFFRVNRHLYAGGWPGARVSALEALCYAIAVGSVVVGWYFDVTYVRRFPAQASWAHFIAMLFTNPASGSIGQDMIVTNGILFPLWTMIDGRRRGLRGTWVYFTMSLFTSFGFAMGLYLAAQERQVRWLVAKPVDGGRGSAVAV